MVEGPGREKRTRVEQESPGTQAGLEGLLDDETRCRFLGDWASKWLRENQPVELEGGGRSG